MIAQSYKSVKKVIAFEKAITIARILH